MNLNHKQAEDKYESIREYARLITLELIPYAEKHAISLEGINHKAILKFKIWQHSPERMVHWEWGIGAADYRKRYPKRFEMATWYHNTLCGLTLGRPTTGGSRMRLDFVERRPGINPLKGKIAAISLTAIEVYARLIDAHEVRIMNPDENLLDYYSSFGYSTKLFKIRGSTSNYLRKQFV